MEDLKPALAPGALMAAAIQDNRRLVDFRQSLYSRYAPQEGPVFFGMEMLQIFAA